MPLPHLKTSGRWDVIPEPGQEVPAAEGGASRLSCLAFLLVGTFTGLHVCGNEQLVRG